MGTRRSVRVNDACFDQLEEKLRAFKDAGYIPVPSATNFMLHELPRALEQLAEDYEANTRPLGDEPFIRMWLDQGRFVTMFGLFVTLADDDSVEVLAIDLDL